MQAKIPDHEKIHPIDGLDQICYIKNIVEKS